MDDRSPTETRADDSADVRSTDDLTQAAAGGLRWVAYARVGIEVLLLGSMVLLASLLPPAAFGIFAVVVIVQELALMMPMEGVGGALVQREEVTREHLQARPCADHRVSLVLTAYHGPLAILSVEPLVRPETEWLTIATTPYFLLGALYSLPMAVLRRHLDFRRISIIELSLNATRAVTMLCSRSSASMRRRSSSEAWRAGGQRSSWPCSSRRCRCRAGVRAPSAT